MYALGWYGGRKHHGDPRQYSVRGNGNSGTSGGQVTPLTQASQICKKGNEMSELMGRLTVRQKTCKLAVSYNRHGIEGWKRGCDSAAPVAASKRADVRTGGEKIGHNSHKQQFSKNNAI